MKILDQELIEVNVVKLEDNLDYVIIDTIKSEKNNYLVLAKKDSEFDVCIRKIIKEDNKEYLVKLDSEEEFEEVMTLYNEKYS